MQFTDSHLHLQAYKAKDAQQIISDLRNLGFVKVVCAATSPKDWQDVAQWAENFPDMVIPAFGLHPWYLECEGSYFISKLESCLARYPNAWVGECGLDNLKAGNLKRQEEVFLSQLELAAKFRRPVNIHLLKAEEQMAKLLPFMPARFMFHSFSGSKEFLALALKKGAYISLSASVLRRKNHLEIISNLPPERLLLESDAPFLSDFKEIPDLAKQIAAIKGMVYDDLISRVNTNLKEFCRG